MSMPVAVEIKDSHAKLNCAAVMRTVLVDSHNRLRQSKINCGSSNDTHEYWVVGPLGRVRVRLCKVHHTPDSASSAPSDAVTP